jgi:hypothetical protein
VSAGILLFRRRRSGLEVLLGASGRVPSGAGRDAGAWTIPKGLVAPDEALLDAARREFREETGLEPDGPFLPARQRSAEGGQDGSMPGPARATPIPPRSPATPRRSSGRAARVAGSPIPRWTAAAGSRWSGARKSLNPAQSELLGRLERRCRIERPRLQRWREGWLRRALDRNIVIMPRSLLFAPRLSTLALSSPLPGRDCGLRS